MNGHEAAIDQAEMAAQGIMSGSQSRGENCNSTQANPAQHTLSLLGICRQIAESAYIFWCCPGRGSLSSWCICMQACLPASTAIQSRLAAGAAAARRSMSARPIGIPSRDIALGPTRMACIRRCSPQKLFNLRDPKQMHHWAANCVLVRHMTHFRTLSQAAAKDLLLQPVQSPVSKANKGGPLDMSSLPRVASQWLCPLMQGRDGSSAGYMHENGLGRHGREGYDERYMDPSGSSAYDPPHGHSDNELDEDDVSSLKFSQITFLCKSLTAC